MRRRVQSCFGERHERREAPFDVLPVQPHSGDHRFATGCRRDPRAVHDLVGDRPVSVVSNARPHRERRERDRTRDVFRVEGREITASPTAADDHDEVGFERREASERRTS